MQHCDVTFTSLLCKIYSSWQTDELLLPLFLYWPNSLITGLGFLIPPPAAGFERRDVSWEEVSPLPNPPNMEEQVSIFMTQRAE